MLVPVVALLETFIFDVPVKLNPVMLDKSSTVPLVPFTVIKWELANVIDLVLVPLSIKLVQVNDALVKSNVLLTKVNGLIYGSELGI